MLDYEIAYNSKLIDISKIGHKLNINDEDLELYGKYKAKIRMDNVKVANNSNLILVTSTSPTPFGEGKTTLSIGIHDALCALGKKSVVVLREPSLGPVFGTKGGATGGGMSQVVPMDDINLHFTGDIHAITSANNLLAAIIDNSIFQGNVLNLDPTKISFKRCLDINDRALRHVTLNNKREDAFNISTASEIMAILCLAKDMDDLEKRLGNILIGYTYLDEPVFARELKCIGSLKVLLKDAMKPNLVQTLEHNPAIIHGGPFANIAHGCNSIIATNIGLNKADYVVTEAGFGSDMGALKFFDIKCRSNNIYPKLVVLNTTIRGLKYNGGDILDNGLSNLEYHILNMLKFTDNLLVVLNKFASDTALEIETLKNFCRDMNVPFEVSTCHKDASKGGISVAKAIIELTTKDTIKKDLLYDVMEPLKDKIEKVIKNIYYAKEVSYTDVAIDKIKAVDNIATFKLPICIAKTQYSITDNPKLLGFPKDNKITVTDICVNSGAGFVTVYLGNIMTMPGMGTKANYLNIDYTNGFVKGIF